MAITPLKKVRVKIVPSRVPALPTYNAPAGGPYLVLSDNPEIITSTDVLWRSHLVPRGVTSLDLRVYLYHLLTGLPSAYFSVLVANRGTHAINATGHGLGKADVGPSGQIIDWTAPLLAQYMAGPPALPAHTIPPAQWRVLASGQATQDQLFHGIYDVTLASAVPLQFYILTTATPAPITSSMPSGITADFLDPKDHPLPAGDHHQRGTFRFSDILKRPGSRTGNITPYIVQNGAQRLVISPSYARVLRPNEGPLPPLDRGIVPFTQPGSDLENYGNYGVRYQISLSLKNNDPVNPHPVFLYLTPGGEHYGGAVQKSGVTWEIPRTERSEFRLLDTVELKPSQTRDREYALMHAGGAGTPANFILTTQPYRP